MALFSVLGLFSARYRQYAGDSFKCVFNMAMLRPCEVDMERRIKNKFLITLANVSPQTARFTNQHFKSISIVFVLVMLATSVYSAYSVYNLLTYGTCDPHSNTCIFNPGAKISCGSEYCEQNGCYCDDPNVGCEAPDFAACNNSCSCNKSVCG